MTHYFDEIGHDGEDCKTDKLAQNVCEGMYIQKCNDVTQLCEALRAVYALAGENKEVRDIIHKAIEEHGGPDA